MVDWVVKKATAEENSRDSCFIVGMADNEEGDGRYLIFQCGLTDPSQQDRRLGFDSYCTLNEMGGVEYGGIREVLLNGRLLSLRFSEEVAESLEMDSESITLVIAPEVNLDLVRAGLRRVLHFGNPNEYPSIMDL
ncbi:Imm10 family immunity protein [Streptomyces sp. NPDC102467]|uniref:Imm10 family immunity protein n=1 Tax=Streptomyces sp. NPDC102467 TaxID=3366179 RepID=UPI0038172B29